MAAGGGCRRAEHFREPVTYPFRVVTRRNASLKPQLNQIRAWVQEGATDIWIAHKLGSTPASISRFRRQHDLRRSDEDPGPAAATVTEAEVAESAAEAPAKRTRRAKAPTAKADAAKAKPAKPAPRSRSKKPADVEEAPEAPAEAEFTPPAEVLATAEPAEADGEPAKRRRGRRGGRGRSRGSDAPLELEAVFDHGEEGYGLWLDGAVRDAGVYRRHWQGHADVVVKITADEIVIRRASSDGDG